VNAQRDHQSEFLRGLVDDRAAIAGDVVEIGANTWAIHGSIPVDGEVILAEYETPDEARAALAALASPLPATSFDGRSKRASFGDARPVRA
jgi:hypothetical protein